MQYRMVRGECLLKLLNEYSTVPDLEHNIEVGFPQTKKRQHATNEVTITGVQYMPFVGTNVLNVSSTSAGHGRQYRQVLQLLKVNFDGAKTEENNAFLAKDGKDFFLTPVPLDQHNVKVRCNCLDFYYRFAHYNYNDKSIVGPPPVPYVRKTNTRPPANPDQTPGLCKHILKLIQKLQTDGVIQG